MTLYTIDTAVTWLQGSRSASAQGIVDGHDGGLISPCELLYHVGHAHAIATLRSRAVPANRCPQG
jgi:hypothetical protein